MLVTLLWFARYSPQTAKVTATLLAKHAKSIQKLFDNNLDTTNWGLFMRNISQLMFTVTELKDLFSIFIEPYTNIFTQIALKELTDQEKSDDSKHFLNCLKVISMKQPILLSKQYLETQMMIILLYVAKNSKSEAVL